VIDVNSLDNIFIDDVMYLFDNGNSIDQIAYIMGCDTATVDFVICSCISGDTTELN
jgi:hypothetical protein